MTPFGIRKRLKAMLGLESAPKKKKPEIPRYSVRFVLPDGSDFEVQAKHGDSLVLASGRGPSPISTGCADSSCGTCQVDVLAGAESLTPGDATEAKTKADNQVPEDRRLGCRAEVIGPGLEVKIIHVFGEEPYMP
jgi:ferredoxin